MPGLRTLTPLPFFEHDAGVATVESRVENSDWRSGLPSMMGSLVTLRELRPTDAIPLFEALSTREVTRFISTPPSSVDGFEKFIAWTHRERTAGLHACFAVVPRGADIAIGLIQLRALDSGFDTAEWGFALAPEFWGTGAFADGARRIIGFAFETLGTRRLEARAAVGNGRGNGALAKLGAIREAVLRRSFRGRSEDLDQALWTILAEDWHDARDASAHRAIH